MKISSLLKGGIYEVSFEYHSKLDGYATLMSDILTLYAIDFETLVRFLKTFINEIFNIGDTRTLLTRRRSEKQ
jgi:hypothetical protein